MQRFETTITPYPSPAATSSPQGEALIHPVSLTIFIPTRQKTTILSDGRFYLFEMIISPVR